MMIRQIKRSKSALALLSSAALLTGCASSGIGLGTPSLEARLDRAQNIARSASLARKDMQTGGYKLASWRKITDPAQPVHIYIEGDGLAWLSRSTPSMNPTPTEPVALQLAAMDRGPNVVYLARPCQYTALSESPSCSQRSWTGGRFDTGVIEAMNEAVAQIDAPAGITLTGFSGGANIAALIAARRQDVKELRTVAGNLAPETLNKIHGVSAMPSALSARSVGPLIAHIPQMHFIGGADEIVTAPVYEAYAATTGQGACVSSEIVPGVTHTKGWAPLWPALMQRPLPCQ